MRQIKTNLDSESRPKISYKDIGDGKYTYSILLKVSGETVRTRPVKEYAVNLEEAVSVIHDLTDSYDTINKEIEVLGLPYTSYMIKKEISDGGVLDLLNTCYKKLFKNKVMPIKEVNRNPQNIANITMELSKLNTLYLLNIPTINSPVYIKSIKHILDSNNSGDLVKLLDLCKDGTGEDINTFINYYFLNGFRSVLYL